MSDEKLTVSNPSYAEFLESTTGKTVTKLVEERAALEQRLAEIEALAHERLVALETLTYRDGKGRYCVGFQGDSDVSDIVAGAISKPKEGA